MPFSDIILQWYDQNKRDLPWRGSRDPYVIWLSEIMLQQTRVAQGMPYFLDFMEHYPAVEDLARASEEEVLKRWEGLGYYSRARNLHHTARHVAFTLGGAFPQSYKGLLELKGVGPYTAAAIASVCFGEAVAVVDGNVYRVLSRYFGVDLEVNSSEGVRYFRELAASLIREDRPGDYNQAVMEFGAVQCTPKSPSCQQCPLSGSCRALETGKVRELPVKRRGKEARLRRLHYLVPVGPGLETCLLRRTGPGIWQGLFEFPCLETESEPTRDSMAACLQTTTGVPQESIADIRCFNAEPIVHKLSHQHLVTTFWIVFLDRAPASAVSLEEARSRPLPVLIANFMDTVKNSYF
ncbi:A/G-specific adenine glycosylase [Robiginitalea sp. M366]|uniref:A/G-specific adenine glycosylase n=1 Tax=Robiginitalea aestuariiviva TaxID=3036903 RepID=UPI00240CE9D5|nr:A/G-specific adenine glycosylase [Robiginitalea aestuariiviva]MDG1571712.1 A/G-specific adenine glycosylase [Robiginitalea aestuariiviva]